MKKLMSYIMLATSVIIFTTCTKESDDSGQSLVWGYTWDDLGTTILKSVDLTSGAEINSISLNKLNSGSENLIFNEATNEMLFTSYDSLYSINLKSQAISNISFIGDSVYGLKLDKKSQILYGLIAQNSKYQFISVNIKNTGTQRIISQINVLKISDILGAALNTNDGQYYFCANDSLYSLNIQDKKIESSILSTVNNIEYNTITKELVGVGNTGNGFALIKMDAQLNNIQEIEFSEEILAFHSLSTFNYKTGEYVFMGINYVVHVVDISTGYVKNVNAEFEKGLEFQFQKN